MSTLWTWWRSGYGMGRHKLQTMNTNCILSMAIWMHRNTVTKSWGPLSCTAPFYKDLYTIHGSWKCPSSSISCIVNRHVTHWACLGCSGLKFMTGWSSSQQYPAISHSHWWGVGQHSKGHNQQPAQLYAKKMCHVAWGKLWSHQILTGFLIHAPTFFFEGICDQQMHICIPSREIPTLVSKSFFKIDWFLYMNCNSSKSSKSCKLHLYFYSV
jgi:hypothetical protein